MRGSQNILYKKSIKPRTPPSIENSGHTKKRQKARLAYLQAEEEAVKNLLWTVEAETSSEPITFQKDIDLFLKRIVGKEDRLQIIEHFQAKLEEHNLAEYKSQVAWPNEDLLPLFQKWQAENNKDKKEVEEWLRAR